MEFVLLEKFGCAGGMVVRAETGKKKSHCMALIDQPKVKVDAKTTDVEGRRPSQQVNMKLRWFQKNQNWNKVHITWRSKFATERLVIQHGTSSSLCITPHLCHLDTWWSIISWWLGIHPSPQLYSVGLLGFDRRQLFLFHTNKAPRRPLLPVLPLTQQWD